MPPCLYCTMPIDCTFFFVNLCALCALAVEKNEPRRHKGHEDSQRERPRYNPILRYFAPTTFLCYNTSFPYTVLFCYVTSFRHVPFFLYTAFYLHFKRIQNNRIKKTAGEVESKSLPIAPVVGVSPEQGGNSLLPTLCNSIPCCVTESADSPHGKNSLFFNNNRKETE